MRSPIDIPSPETSGSIDPPRRQRLDASRLHVGEFLSDVQYYKVVKVSPRTVTVSNERGFESKIDRTIIEEGMYSAGQYNLKQTLNRSQACELLENAGSAVFTVNFRKQVREKELREQILEAIATPDGELLGRSELQKRIKQVSKTALEGEERTLIGYLVDSEPRMGRSTVIDLNIPPDRDRLRLVDHRTLNWLIIRNVKYIVR
jgi:hypothetical protein